MPTATKPDDLRARLGRLEELRRLRVAADTGRPPWAPEPHQKPPEALLAHEAYLWLLLAGRGSGKTDACADYFDRYMRYNAGHRGAIVAPTIGDAVESCVNGPSGLLAHNPNVKLRQTAGGTHVYWPNGSEAKLFGAFTREDIERLRAGGNRHIAWFEEWAAWRYIKEATEQVEFGLRLGQYPHIVASTTPKPRPLIKKYRDATTTVLTTATMFDNPHLPERVRAALLEKYEGTRLGRQELMGELIEEAEGALWTFVLLEDAKVDEYPDLIKVVVGVDPSGGDEDGNDEQGIIVAGLGVDGLGYVIADRSCKLTPDGWGRRAVQAYADFNADKIVVESNFGGDMAQATIQTAAEKMGVDGVKVEKVTASRGKQVRAEPVSALYEQHRVKHYGVLERLEYQQTQWTQESGWSPDRLDAGVFCLTDLFKLGKPKRRWGPA